MRDSKSNNLITIFVAFLIALALIYAIKYGFIPSIQIEQGEANVLLDIWKLEKIALTLIFSAYVLRELIELANLILQKENHNEPRMSLWVPIMALCASILIYVSSKLIINYGQPIGST